MSLPEVTKTVTINNPKGLHLRPAGMLSQMVGQFQSEVTLAKDGLTVSAASVLDLLTLVATCGSEVVVVAKGEDAEQAADAVAQFIESDCTEEEEPS